MKKALSVILVIFLILSISACSTPGTSPQKTPEPTKSASETGSNTSKPEKIDMRIMWWGSQTRHDRTLAVLDLYTKKNSHITFQPEFMGSNDYWQKLNTLVAANDVPDVFQIGNNFLTYYSAIEPLDEYAKNGLIDVSDTNENFLSTTRINGELLGISLGTNSLAMLYDPAIFDQAGIPYPTTDWTWDEFEKACYTIKEKTGLYGSSLLNDFFIGGIISIPQYGTGETFYNEDVTGLGYKDDQFFANYLQMKYNLTKAGAYPTPGELAEIKDIEGDLIVTGKAAITWVHSNQLVAVMNAANRPLAITVPPKRTKDGPSGLCIRSSQAMSIYNKSKYKEEAAKFISFFVNDVDANYILDGERGVPIMGKVRSALAEKADSVTRQMYEFVDLTGQLASNPPPVEPAAQIEIQDIITRVNEQVIFDQVTPLEGAQIMRKEVEQALQRSN